MLKILIVGAKGQVGLELVRQSGMHEIMAVGRDELDITDKAAVLSFVNQMRPNMIINAAAYTAVDKAEDDVVAAFAVNATAVGHLAQACEQMSIPLVHISTDYVFDGSKQGAYNEGDMVSPLGVYGKSKLEGEELVQKYCSRYYIFRTSWVFSAHGNNFVKTMLRLGAEREVLGVVADQVGKPTSASEIARVIYEIIGENQQAWGIYHLAQPDVVSWHGFAQGIFSEGKAQGIPLQIKQVNAITTADYPTPAKRPANSELACVKLEQTFDLTLKPWRESLLEVIKDLNNE